eukprot:IDg20402t1
MTASAFASTLGVRYPRRYFVRTSFPRLTPRRARFTRRVHYLPRAQLTNDTPENSGNNAQGKSDDFDSDLLPEAARRRIGKDPQELLQRLENIPRELEDATSQ